MNAEKGPDTPDTSLSDASARPAGPLFLSASRSKDLLRSCPDFLAEVLRGERPISLGFGRKADWVPPERIAALVLWTKDPRPLSAHRALREALEDFLSKKKGRLLLQLTVTGFGQSVIEPGIPTTGESLEALSKLIEAGLLLPAAVKFRFDPFGEIEMAPGHILSNMQLPLFTEIAEKMARLDIRAATASQMDAVNYPKIHGRLQDLGLKLLPTTSERARSFTAGLASVCERLGIIYSTCVNPTDGLNQGQGCLDGAYLNRVLGLDGPSEAFRFDDTPHNAAGRQRPGCFCSYSHDIGYSPGTRHCFPTGSGCLYCFSQGPQLNRHLAGRLRDWVNRLKQEPEKLRHDPQHAHLLVDKPYGER